MRCFVEITKKSNEITNVFFQESVLGGMKSKKYLEIDPEFGKDLSQKITKGVKIIVTKDEDFFTSDDIDIDDDDLEVSKRKAEMLLGEMRNVNISAMEIFSFLMAFNNLASKGYFITDDNREEKYLEIINSGDEELLDDLEVYLESLEELEVYVAFYNKNKQFRRKIKEAKNKEEVQEALDLFESNLSL